MGDIFDLDSIALADNEPFQFVFGGETFELPANPDIDFVAHLAKGRFDLALKETLGDEQYQKLVDLDEVMTFPRAQALFDAYSDTAIGVDQGKSSGRSKSSKRTKAK